MEDAGRQHCVGMAFGHALDQVLQLAHAAGGNDRDTHRIADRPGQFQIEPDPGAITVHAGQQDLAGPEGLHPLRPLDDFQIGLVAPTVGEHLPARGLAFRADALGVDRDHDALAADPVGRLAHQLRAVHGGGINRDLVGPGIQQAADILHRPHAATHGQRDKDLARDLLDHMQDGVAIITGGRDIEKGDLVRALRVVAPRDLHRVAGIADADKVHALDDAAGIDIQAGDDALGQHLSPRTPPCAPLRA